MNWKDICCNDEYRGQWIALDNARYDQVSGRATDGAVLDSDFDLVALCDRIKRAKCKNCAILLCGRDSIPPQASA
ncbi:MAG: hypothetical protein IPJ88_09380 [Myxococcales bacterium]|nr:MAG: hypothetical protein IPJ88_09380 [Myxococcales bacterium]